MALNIPADIGEAIAGFVETLKDQVRGVRWVRTGHLHLTLKFLGDIEESDVGAVGDALEQAATRKEAFNVSLRGTGFFPPRGRPRVVWVDVAAGAESLAGLQDEIEASLEPLGVEREDRTFRPHLTIGRVKDGRHREKLASLTAAAADREWGAFRCERIHLMRSELFPTGPRYSILRELRLRT